MSQRDYFNRLVDVETDRRLNAEFGDLGQSIMDAAKEQAYSETQVNMIHEETLAYALAAGQAPKFTKEQVTEIVKKKFDTTPISHISSDLLIQTTGRLDRKIQEAASKGDWAEAYRLYQPKQRAVVATKMAIEYEKLQGQLDRTAKTFRKREVGSTEQPFTNWVHDLLARVGMGSKEFLQGDLHVGLFGLVQVIGDHVNHASMVRGLNFIDFVETSFPCFVDLAPVLGHQFHEGRIVLQGVIPGIAEASEVQDLINTHTRGDHPREAVMGLTHGLGPVLRWPRVLQGEHILTRQRADPKDSGGLGQLATMKGRLSHSILRM